MDKWSSSSGRLRQNAMREQHQYKVEEAIENVQIDHNIRKVHNPRHLGRIAEVRRPVLDVRPHLVTHVDVEVVGLALEDVGLRRDETTQQAKEGRDTNSERESIRGEVSIAIEIRKAEWNEPHVVESRQHFPDVG